MNNISPEDKELRSFLGKNVLDIPPPSDDLENRIMSRTVQTSPGWRFKHFLSKVSSFPRALIPISVLAAALIGFFFDKSVKHQEPEILSDSEVLSYFSETMQGSTVNEDQLLAYPNTEMINSTDNDNSVRNL